MKEYKQPETRIKRVLDEKGERFYAQYKQVIIPHILWEWQNTRESLEDEHFVCTLDAARARVDRFLEKSKHQWACDIERAERKKRIKKEVEYIKYP